MRIGILSASLICAAGNTLDESWNSLMSGLRIMPSPFYMPGRDKAVLAYQISMGRPYNRLQHIAEQAAGAAIVQAGMPIEALVVGSSSAGFTDAEQEWPYPMPGNLTQRLGSLYGIVQSYQMGQACAASSHAIAFGADMIRAGLAQIVLVGGSDEITQSAVAAFEAVRLYGEESKPFDINRSKLILGEGAAFFVLAAEGIGEPIAYLDGWGMSTDAMDPAAPDFNGIQQSIMEALYMLGGLTVMDINFICCHGTGTKLNDVAESQAIRGLWGPSMPIVSSYKGALGHPQGASGAVGLALTIKSMREGIMFPTWNLDDQDPEIDVPTITVPKAYDIRQAMVLSSGSWGANAALIVSRE